ncbi:hypothetical protein ACFE04_001667 [Oxalis oulophora]
MVVYRRALSRCHTFNLKLKLPLNVSRPGQSGSALSVSCNSDLNIIYCQRSVFHDPRRTHGNDIAGPKVVQYSTVIGSGYTFSLVVDSDMCIMYVWKCRSR